MRLTLMHHPGAGDDQPSRDGLVARLRRAGYDVSYQSMKETGFDQALDDPGDLVLVAGGDGSVAKVAKRLVGRDVSLAIVPLGTSNNIARSLGVFGSPDEIIDALATAAVTTLDVASARAPWGTSHFIEAIGVGFFGNVLRRAAERRERERAEPATTPVPTALRGIRRALDGYRARERRVVADGKDLSGSYVMVEVMNVRSIGPRMALAPSADVSDGRLDLLLLRETDRRALGDYLSAVADGSAARFPIPSRRVRRVTLGWDADDGHLDDDVWPELDARERASSASGSDMVEAEIVHLPLRVLVPDHTHDTERANPATMTSV